MPLFPRHRRTALAQLGRDRLAALTDAYDLVVADRRVLDQHVDALVRARNVAFDDVLRQLKRDELQSICAALGLDTGGREKEALVGRILGMGNDAEPAASASTTAPPPTPAPGTLTRPMTWSTRALVVLAACLLGCGGAEAPVATDGPTAEVNTSDGGGSDAADSDAVSLGGCGGYGGYSCPAEAYCDYWDKTCGGYDGTGACRPLPVDCPSTSDPVCGCGGVIYVNECQAYAARNDVYANGGCTPPAGTFGCGWRFCSVATQYCLAAYSAVAGRRRDYSCQPLPDACAGTASCDCLAGERCGNHCTAFSGGFWLICPGA